MTPRVVLVGPPGAGKSTVGRAVARRLGLTFRDTDADIETQVGKPIADIFVDSGEAVFRELERAAVAAALAEHDGVLALGGGAVEDPATQQALRGHTVVFLDVALSSAARRVGFNRDRPLLLGNPRKTLMALMAVRRPAYLAVATAAVSADASAAAVADAVVAAITPAGRTSAGGNI